MFDKFLKEGISKKKDISLWDLNESVIDTEHFDNSDNVLTWFNDKKQDNDYIERTKSELRDEIIYNKHKIKTIKKENKKSRKRNPDDPEINSWNIKKYENNLMRYKTSLNTINNLEKQHKKEIKADKKLERKLRKDIERTRNRKRDTEAIAENINVEELDFKFDNDMNKIVNDIDTKNINMEEVNLSKILEDSINDSRVNKNDYYNFSNLSQEEIKENIVTDIKNTDWHQKHLESANELVNPRPKVNGNHIPINKNKDINIPDLDELIKDEDKFASIIKNHMSPEDVKEAIDEIPKDWYKTDSIYRDPVNVMDELIHESLDNKTHRHSTEVKTIEDIASRIDEFDTSKYHAPEFTGEELKKIKIPEFTPTIKELSEDDYIEINEALSKEKEWAKKDKKRILKKASRVGQLVMTAGGAILDYKSEREEGHGVIRSAASAGVQFAVGEALGWWMLPIGVASSLPSAAIKGVTTLQSMTRDMNNISRLRTFNDVHFQDTQHLATMRQSGMELAKMSQYNLQQSIMGNEATHMHKY